MTWPEPPDGADRLLQGLQGLVLQLHAISCDLPSDQPTRRALERWMESADRLMDQGCADGVARGQQRPAGVVTQLMGLVTLGPTQPRRLRLRVQLGRLPFQLCGGLQHTLGQLACEQVRRACAEAGATQVTVQVQGGSDGLLLRVRDNGRWGRGWPGRRSQEAPADVAPVALQTAARQLGAGLRLWHWPGAGGELQLQLPARRAYDFGEPQR